MKRRSQLIEERARETEQRLSREFEESLERIQQLTAEKEQVTAEVSKLACCVCISL